jgi:hypothetical protein
MRRDDLEALDVLAGLPPATLTAMVAAMPRASRLPGLCERGVNVT